MCRLTSDGSQRSAKLVDEGLDLVHLRGLEVSVCRREREKESQPKFDENRETKGRTLEESSSLLLDLMQSVELADHEQDILLGSSRSSLGGRTEHSEDVTEGREGERRRDELAFIFDGKMKEERDETNPVV